MMSVFERVEGSGTEERSMVRGLLLSLEVVLEDRDRGGEISTSAIVVGLEEGD